MPSAHRNSILDHGFSSFHGVFRIVLASYTSYSGVSQAQILYIVYSPIEKENLRNVSIVPVILDRYRMLWCWILQQLKIYGERRDGWPE